MKRNTKRIAGLALALIVIGLIGAGIGRAMGGKTSMTVNMFGRRFYIHPLGIYGSEPYSRTHAATPAPAATGIPLAPAAPEAPNHPTVTVVENVMNSFSDFELGAFDRIDVDVSFAEVSIVRGKDFGIELSWHESGTAMECNLRNGLLRVFDAPGARSWLQNAQGGRVTIYMPSSGTSFEDVTVRSSFGAVTVRDVETEILIIDADFGEVTLTNCTFDTGEIINAFGSTTGKGLTSRGLTVDNDFGAVDLRGDLTGYLDIDSDMGEVTVVLDGPRSDYFFTVEADFGSVSIDGEKFTNRTGGKGEHSLNIDCDAGSVTIHFGG